MGNISLPLDYVVIDFETTGFNPYNDKIIQVAAVKYRNHELVDQFVSLCESEASNPGPNNEFNRYYKLSCFGCTDD